MYDGLVLCLTAFDVAAAKVPHQSNIIPMRRRNVARTQDTDNRNTAIQVIF